MHINFLPTYSYHYFSHNQLQTKELNIFQCLLRKAFGWYAETHLLNVVRQAYKITLSTGCNGSPHDQDLLKLIKKAETVYFSKGFFKRTEYLEPRGGYKVAHKIKYSITADRKDPSQLKIASVWVKVIIQGNNEGNADVKQKFTLSLNKNASGDMVVCMPHFFEGAPKDNDFEINLRFDGVFAKIMNTFVAKALYDSPAIGEIQYGATDYYGLQLDEIHTVRRSTEEIQNYKGSLNDTQSQALSRSGWHYLNTVKIDNEKGYIFKDNQYIQTVRVYSLTRAAAVSSLLEAQYQFNQNLSLNFAAYNLARSETNWG